MVFIVRPVHVSGSVAERSKALVLGTSLFGGVGSNPTAAINIFVNIYSFWHYVLSSFSSCKNS